MKVLVTGAGGMLGREVVERFEAGGHHRVIAVPHADLDIGSRDAVLQCVLASQPDAIINCAAFTAVDRCEAETDLAFGINALGVRHLGEAAARCQSHLVHVSTDYVFDGTKVDAYHEWDDPCPQSVYGASKLGGEREAFAALGDSCTVARTAWVCGRYGNNMLKTVLKVAGGDAPLRFVADQRGCPTFADDLAAMLYQFAIERRPGLFHVTNQGAVSWYEFVTEIVRQTGGDVGRVHAISTAELQPPRPAPRPANSVLDNLALRLSGIELLSDHREALTRCLAAIDG